MSQKLKTFDQWFKGYKNYAAYALLLLVVLILYFGKGTDLDGIAAVLHGLAAVLGVGGVIFGAAARAAQDVK